MPTLIDEIITVKFFLFSFSLTIILLWLLVKYKVLDSWADPSIVSFFQLTITFFSLSYLSILPLSQIIGFAILIVILFSLKINLKPVKLISTKFWIEFSYFLFVIVVVLSVFLTIKKGFIYFVEDATDARLVYYQGYGFFQRINMISTPIFAINSFYFLRANKKKRFYIYLITTIYLLITLGSKSSLIALVFFYGAYYKFHRETESVFLKRNRGKLFLLISFLFITSLGMFFLIYRDNFTSAFTYRMISMADGPFYFYYDHLEKWISYSPLYMFDQFFVATRVYPDLKYMGLGAAINYYYYDYYDLLNGPNPQIFVESAVLFGPFFWIMYVVIPVVYVFLRKLCSSPITFYFIASFTVTLTIDTQYAFSLIFDYMILAGLLMLFLGLKIAFKSIEVDESLNLNNG